MRTLLRAFAVFNFIIHVGAACANNAYPTRPIRFIVNFPAGGTGDLVARTIQPHLEKQLGQPVIIENRAGAGGVIGTEAVAKAAPDGYVIGMGGTGSMAINVALREKMPYDPLKDLKPVSLLVKIPFVFAGARSLNANSIAEVLALGRSMPAKLSIGHGGNGSAMQLTAQLFNQMAGLDLTLVPYKGSAPLANDILAGHVPLGVMDMSSIALIRAGKIKPLAVSSAHRLLILPDVPTIAESGFAGFDSAAWLGMVVPTNTSAAIVTKLNEAVVEALNDPEVQERIRAIGAEPAPSSPSDLDQFIRAEIAKWTKVAVAAGMTRN